MSSTESQIQLGTCLAGIFQNRAQALAEPAWFVHLKLWCCPVSLFEDSYTFFIEQASAAFQQPPYRQRVLRIRCWSTELTAEYYALKAPQDFQGAAQNSEQLQTLTVGHLESLIGSRLLVNIQPGVGATRFVARHYPKELCQFSVGDEVKWVQLGFDAIAPVPGSKTSASFWMYDQGIDPITNKSTWGATNGPFKLVKIQDLSDRLGSLH